MKYIFLDIDGTLFDHKTYAIPGSARRAVELARRAGNKVFICTGRSCCMLEDVEGIAFDGVVAAAGAYAETEGKIIYEDRIPEEELERILEFGKSMGVSYILEGKEGIYMHSMIRDYYLTGDGKYTPGHKFFQRKSAYGMESYHPDSETIYKFCLYSLEAGALQEVERKFKDSYQFISSMPERGRMHSVEVISVRNNKAGGIRKVLEYYGKGMEDAVAVGDSMNDLEMIRECGTGIVMGNGSEQLKAYADHVTADIGEDGLYRALEYYHLLG